MAASSTELVEDLISRIAFAGDAGIGVEDVERYINEYYEAKNKKQELQGNPPSVHEPRSTEHQNSWLFSSAPPIAPVVVDDALIITVWTWLEQNPEVEVREGLSLAQQPHGVGRPPTRFVDLDRKRLFTSESRLWKAVAGHDIDRTRIPNFEFQCLVVIAERGAEGIMQPELVRITGQDKRSLPKRTGALADKGYITKEVVIHDGTRTSLLRLKKYDVPSASPSNVPESLVKGSAKSHRSVAQQKEWYDKTMSLLQSQTSGIVAYVDLRVHLGIEGKIWETRALNRCIRRLCTVGCLTRVSANDAAHGDPNKRKEVRCIMLVRPPMPTDRMAWIQFSSTAQMADPQPEASAAVDHMAEESDAENDAIKTANPGLAHPNVVPKWNTFLPITNLIYRVVESAGPQGISSMDLSRHVSPFWRRPLDEVMAKLTDIWRVSQPEHLRHLSIIRDTGIKNKGSHYVYRTYRHFQAAVDQGLTVWEAVQSDQSKKKKRQKQKNDNDIGPPELDEWGFPKKNVSSKRVADRPKEPKRAHKKAKKAKKVSTAVSEPSVYKTNVYLVEKRQAKELVEFKKFAKRYVRNKLCLEQNGLGASDGLRGVSEERRNEMESDIVAMRAPCVYINPPGAADLKAKELHLRGRWPKSCIAVIKVPDPTKLAAFGADDHEKTPAGPSQMTDISPVDQLEATAGDDRGLTPLNAGPVRSQRRKAIRGDNSLADSHTPTGVDPSSVGQTGPLDVQHSDHVGEAPRPDSHITNVQVQVTSAGKGFCPATRADGSSHHQNKTEDHASPVPASDVPESDSGDKQDHVGTPLPGGLVEEVHSPTKARNLKRPGVSAAEGIIYLRRKEIVVDTLTKCGGVFPGNNEILYPFATAWEKLFSQRPDRHTVANTITNLLGSRIIRKFNFRFRGKAGKVETRGILMLDHVDPASEPVQALRQKIIEHYPSKYIPEGVEILPEYRTKMANHAIVLGQRIADGEWLNNDGNATEVALPHYTRDEFPFMPDVVVQRIFTDTKVTSKAKRPGKRPRETETNDSPSLEDARPEKQARTALRDSSLPDKVDASPAATQSPPIADYQMPGSSSQTHLPDPTRWSSRPLLPYPAHQTFVQPRNAHDMVPLQYNSDMLSTGLETYGIASLGWRAASGVGLDTPGALDPSLSSISSQWLPPYDRSNAAGQPTNLVSYRASITEDLPTAPMTHARPALPPVARRKPGPKPKPRLPPEICALMMVPNQPFHEASGTFGTNYVWPVAGKKKAKDVSEPCQEQTQPELAGEGTPDKPQRKRRKDFGTTRSKKRAHASVDHLIGNDEVASGVDDGNLPKRKRHKRKDATFDIDKLMAAVALVRMLCAGIGQRIVNWDVVVHCFSFRYTANFVRMQWLTLRPDQKNFVTALQNAMREPFLQAYESGELDSIDFQELGKSDWPAMLTWVETQVVPIVKGLGASVSETLPKTRRQFDRRFEMKAPRSQHETASDDFFGATMLVHRREVAHRQFHGLLIPDGSPPDPMTAVKTWCRAVAMAKERGYDAAQAAGKILSHFSSKEIDQANKDLAAENYFVSVKKDRQLPGRNYHIGAYILKQFRRWPNPEDHYLELVAAARHTVMAHFEHHATWALSMHTHDPTMTVLINLVAQGFLRIRSDMPEPSADPYATDGAGLSGWGFFPGEYTTKQQDSSKWRFPIVYEKTPLFPVGAKHTTGSITTASGGTDAHLASLRPGAAAIPREPRGPFPGEGVLRIPFWIDIAGNLLVDAWEMVVRSVLHLVVFRPGVTTEIMAKNHRHVLGAWEVELVIEWMHAVGLVRHDGPGGHATHGAWTGGWRASDWWYCAWSPEMVTWRTNGVL